MASYLGDAVNGDDNAGGGDKWAAVLENLIKFPSAFSVPPSQIKLTQVGDTVPIAYVTVPPRGIWKNFIVSNKLLTVSLYLTHCNR